MYEVIMAFIVIASLSVGLLIYTYRNIDNVDDTACDIDPLNYIENDLD